MTDEAHPEGTPSSLYVRLDRMGGQGDDNAAPSPQGRRPKGRGRANPWAMALWTIALIALPVWFACSVVGYYATQRGASDLVLVVGALAPLTASLGSAALVGAMVLAGARWLDERR